MRVIATSLLLGMMACKGGPEGDTEATGAATYPEASDAPEREVPEEQDDGMTVSVEASGTGDFDLPTAECPTDVSGAFNTFYTGDAEVRDGIYVATFSESEATLESPGGCALSEITGAVYTDVVVRGEIVATTESCETYCEGWAASEAETACSGDSDEASCRSSQEAELSASCEQECTTNTDVIVAEASLGASALTALNSAALTGAALGTVEVDLRFDRMEDSSGDEVDPEGR